jgi:hypothetical protein
MTIPQLNYQEMAVLCREQVIIIIVHTIDEFLLKLFCLIYSN